MGGSLDLHNRIQFPCGQGVGNPVDEFPLQGQPKSLGKVKILKMDCPGRGNPRAWEKSDSCKWIPPAGATPEPGKSRTSENRFPQQGQPQSLGKVEFLKMDSPGRGDPIASTKHSRPALKHCGMGGNPSFCEGGRGGGGNK